MTFLSDQFINDQVHEIKEGIVLPESGFFVRTENGIRLCHVIDGKFYFLVIPSREATAQYLVDNGLIDSFGLDGADVILYRNSYYWDFDHNYKPVMLYVRKPVAWDKIKLTKSDVRLLAARKEADRCLAGIPLDKVKMYTPAKYNF